MGELGRLIEETLERIVDRVVARRLDEKLKAISPEMLDRKQIAKVLGCCVDTVDNWKKLGMPYVQPPGSHPKFIAADCLEWARRNHTKQSND